MLYNKMGFLENLIQRMEGKKSRRHTSQLEQKRQNKALELQNNKIRARKRQDALERQRFKDKQAKNNEVKRRKPVRKIGIAGRRDTKKRKPKTGLLRQLDTSEISFGKQMKQKLSSNKGNNDLMEKIKGLGISTAKQLKKNKKQQPRIFVNNSTASNKSENGRGSVHLTRPDLPNFTSFKKMFAHSIDVRGNQIQTTHTGDIMT